MPRPVDLPIDWAGLRAEATEAAERAHAPYSTLCVGAAGLVDGARIITGCNVENPSYGLTLCAECALVGDFYRQGASALIAVSIVTPDGDLLWPCGRCRQILLEVGGPDVLIDAVDRPVPLAVLLPNAFDSNDLPTKTRPAESAGKADERS